MVWVDDRFIYFTGVVGFGENGKMPFILCEE